MQSAILWPAIFQVRPCTLVTGRMCIDFSLYSTKTSFSLLFYKSWHDVMKLWPIKPHQHQKSLQKIKSPALSSTADDKSKSFSLQPAILEVKIYTNTSRKLFIAQIALYLMLYRTKSDLKLTMVSIMNEYCFLLMLYTSHCFCREGE